MENIIKCSHPKMTGQNDRHLTGQVHDQAGHSGSTKTRNPESENGNGNGNRNGIRNQILMIEN